MSEINAQLAANLEKMRAVVMLIRASGGYKYRSLIRATDKQVEDATQQAFADLTDLVVSYTVAVKMLQELPPSGVHARWGEYVERRARVVAALSRPEEPAKSRIIIPFRRPEPEKVPGEDAAG